MKKLVLIFSIAALIPILSFSGTGKTKFLYMQALNNDYANALTAYRKKSYTKALNRFETLSRYGIKDAQFMLGMMLVKGTGTPVDMVRGISWLYVASEAKPAWVKLADSYFATLTQDQKRAVKKRVTRYLPLFGMDAQKVSCRRDRITGTNLRKLVCRKIRDVFTGNFDEQGKRVGSLSVKNDGRNISANAF